MKNKFKILLVVLTLLLLLSACNANESGNNNSQAIDPDICSISIMYEPYSENYMVDYRFHTIVYSEDNSQLSSSSFDDLQASGESYASDNIQPHIDEINAFFEENKEAALEKELNLEHQKYVDVTDWFPSEINLTCDGKQYDYSVTKVEMRVVTNSFNGEPVGQVYPSEVVQNKNGTYIYSDGVAFQFHGVTR